MFRSASGTRSAVSMRQHPAFKCTGRHSAPCCDASGWSRDFERCRHDPQGRGDRISLGELETPGFRIRSRDDIRTLADSLARRRKSLVRAMKMREA